MNVLTKPLTFQEIKEKADENNFIDGVVAISLGDLMKMDFEGCLDMLAEALIGCALLSEIDYEIVGHSGDDTLFLRVSGDAEVILNRGEV